jgi:hypothetical protein
MIYFYIPNGKYIKTYEKYTMRSREITIVFVDHPSDPIALKGGKGSTPLIGSLVVVIAQILMSSLAYSCKNLKGKVLIKHF